MGKANRPDLEPTPRGNRQGEMARPCPGRRGGMCLGGARPGVPAWRSTLPARSRVGACPGCDRSGIAAHSQGCGFSRTRSAALDRSPHAACAYLRSSRPAHPAGVKPLTLLLFLPPPSRPVGVVLQPRPGAEPALHNPCAGGTATAAAAL